MDQLYDIVVTCRVHCTHRRAHPRYRLWVADELFTERTWIWDDDIYLEETVVMSALPGQYQIRVELVPGDQAKLSINGFEVQQGPGRVDVQGLVEI